MATMIKCVSKVLKFKVYSTTIISCKYWSNIFNNFNYRAKTKKCNILWYFFKTIQHTGNILCIQFSMVGVNFSFSIKMSTLLMLLLTMRETEKTLQMNLKNGRNFTKSRFCTITCGSTSREILVVMWSINQSNHSFFKNTYLY